jgi:hypothetical protein
VEPLALGLALKEVLDAYERHVQERLRELPEELAPQPALSPIEEITRHFRAGSIEVEVSRRRSHTPCPFPGCRHSHGGKPCPHSSLQLKIMRTETGGTLRIPGILWHLLADHGSAGDVAIDLGQLASLLEDRG